MAVHFLITLHEEIEGREDFFFVFYSFEIFYCEGTFGTNVKPLMNMI